MGVVEGLDVALVAGVVMPLKKVVASDTAAAEQAGVRVAHLRTGIVLSPKGGALKKLLPLFRLGLGGRFGNGKQWQSWISLTDEVRAIESLLTADVSGPGGMD